MKKAVAICETSLHLLNAINLMINCYADYEFDLIISDRITGADTLVGNAKESHAFKNVYLVPVKEKERERTYSWYFSLLKRKNAQKRILKYNNSLSFDYDAVFFNTIYFFENMFCFAQEHKPELVWFEEAGQTYNTQGDFWSVKNINFKEKIRRLFPNMYYQNKHISIQYLYHPELAVYTVPFERKIMPPLTQNQKNLVTIANKIFAFTEKDIIKEKYIYFEESYRIDGFNINDLEILSKIASVIGTENLIVKIHPRSDPELIKKTYKINKNTFVPFELIYLNMSQDEINSKVLLGISTNCISCPLFYFDNRKKVICLLNILDESQLSDEKKRYLNYLRKYIYEKNPDVFSMPMGYEQLEKILENTI